MKRLRRHAPVKVQQQTKIIDTDDIVAEGTFGDITRSYVVPTHRELARKVMPTNYRAAREVLCLQMLKHRHVASMYDWFVTGAHCCVYLDLYSTSLDAFLEANTFEVPERLRLVEQIGDALHHAHREFGLVHRNVRPSHIFIKSFHPLDVVLGGWGAARGIRPNERSLTVDNFFAVYMSPEMPKGQYDEMVDTWALGCVLYEMICGYSAIALGYELRWAGDDPQELKLLRGLLQRNPKDRMDAAGVMHILRQSRVACPARRAEPLSRVFYACESGVVRDEVARSVLVMA